MMERTIEQEFQAFKIQKVWDNTVNLVTRYNLDIGNVDIPEFAKMPEDKISYQADMYVKRLIEENRLDDEFNKLLNV